MTSFTSNSSFGGRSSFSEGSDLSTSPNFSRMPKFDEMRRDGPMQAIEDEGALTHPVLSSFNRDVVVAGEFGLAKMQTKAEWEKQMAAFDKEDAKKAKKDARKAKHAKKVEPPPQTKAMKKAKKHMGEMDDGPDDDL